MSCTVYDPVNKLIIVAGNSTSEDYAPAANDHAFAYAIDLESNWVWGKFFYNVSFAVSTISGCHLDANNALVLLGIGDSKPVIMELDTTNGEVSKYVSLEMIGTSSDNTPWFATYGGIYHETRDIYGKDESYYYVSFIMSDMTQILKINSNPKNASAELLEHEIVWNVEYTNVTDTTNPWTNKKTPRFLHSDSSNEQYMYLLGRHWGKASIFRFSKNNARINWYLQVNNN